ncbi:MAG: alpha/beta hydrolase [Myxococcales bacterium]|nr:alpha/beta hydrolase [Myxococcales bacterium]
MRKPRLVEEHEAAGRRIVVNGRQIFVREEGHGEPVLLLHGVPSSSFLFRKMLTPIAEAGFRAISFDFPGVGLSDKPKDLAYDWHALSKWVGRVVDALELPPVHLVVHDIAGPIGVEWAIHNPVKVRSVTITNTLLDVADFSPPFPMWTFRVPVMRHLVFSTMNTPTMLQLFRQTGVKNPEAIDQDTIASYIYLLKSNGGHHSFLEIMAGFDLTEQHRDWLRDGLLAIDKPMQLIWGEQENSIPKAQLDYICQAFPLRAEHMVEARHFLQEEQPEVVAAHITSFAKGVADQPKRATNAPS